MLLGLALLQCSQAQNCSGKIVNISVNYSFSLFHSDSMLNLQKNVAIGINLFLVTTVHVG